MPKFKVGDIIHIKDIDDWAYALNHMYEIMEYNNLGYSIKSLQTGQIYSVDTILGAARKYKFEANKIYIEEAYRLATKAELVLYENKIKV